MSSTVFVHVNKLGYYWTGPDEFNPNTGCPLVRKSYFFFQGQGIVREFCEMIREILNTKKVREIPNFGPNLLGCGRYFIHFE